MAYRRRHGLTRVSTFKEEIYHPNSDDNRNETNVDDNEDGNDTGSKNRGVLLAICTTKVSMIHRDPSSVTSSPSPLSSSFSHSQDHSLRSLSFPKEDRTNIDQKVANIINETCNKTIDILPEQRNLQIRRRGCGSDNQEQTVVLQNTSWQRPVLQPIERLANGETQLKASRDVAMATAAKAKVLLRELKTVKADLAFAKERCSQIEEENKRLRESKEKGDNNHADDDLVRLQLETLLAEKARLTHENSIYARENQFLREIVEYHQLTMQDIINLDEGGEEDTDIYPFSIEEAASPISPFFPMDISPFSFPLEMKQQITEVSKEVSNTTTP